MKESIQSLFFFLFFILMGVEAADMAPTFIAWTFAIVSITISSITSVILTYERIKERI